MKPNILLESLTRMLKILFFGHIKRTHQSRLSLQVQGKKMGAPYSVDGRYQRYNLTLNEWHKTVNAKLKNVVYKIVKRRKKTDV